MRYNRNRHYDPLVVDALVQRFPVPAAAPADRCAAAKQLHERGYSSEQIGSWLGCDPRQVTRMVHQCTVEPLPEPMEIPEGSWPSCRNGHELSPDNVYVRRKFGRPFTECVTCRRIQQDNKNAKRR